jgi:hypothetical protein
MHRIIRSARQLALVAVLAAGAVIVPATAGNAATRTRLAVSELVCHEATIVAGPRVVSGGHGYGLPANTRIEVKRDIYVNGKFWRTRWDLLVKTSRTGDFKVPTKTYETFLAGKYEQWINVRRTDGKQWLAGGHTTCRINFAE